MADVKFNVYYSSAPQGPWILSNQTPIDRIPEGNNWTVSGLVPNTTYYFLVVGGVVEDDEFIPLRSQAIGPNSIGAIGVGSQAVPTITARTFAPQKAGESMLGQTFTFGVVDEDPLSQQFNINALRTEDALGQQFGLGIFTDTELGQEFEINAIIGDASLSQQFRASVPFSEDFESDGPSAWNADAWYRSNSAPDDGVHTFSEAGFAGQKFAEDFQDGW